MPTDDKPAPEPGERLLAIDALRGFDMFWIIGGDRLGRALGTWSGTKAGLGLRGQLEHAEWEGFRFYDLIFTLFLFLVGAVLLFSMEKFRGGGRGAAYRRIARRTALLFGLGLLCNGLLQFRWEELRIAGVLRSKEDPGRTEVLTDPADLRRRLQETDPGWEFGDEQMMTAVDHLANYGYVRVLVTSTGERRILLAPELLNNLASSFVLEARRSPKGLGALDEGRVLKGDYPFPELNGLDERDRQTLLDAAARLFLGHNLCFREPYEPETYLIFPELINQKKPRIDDGLELEDDVSYEVSGEVENAYASMVVLLGYTTLFTRTNQWQGEAQYELGTRELCGFRQLAGGLEGEIKFVLYFARGVGQPTRLLFQGLFERILTRRRVQITRYPPVVCPKQTCGDRQGREDVVRRVREKSPAMFCSKCGRKISLAGVGEVVTPGPDARDQFEGERATAELRTRYESALVTVKSLARKRRKKKPVCFISYAWGEPKHEQWVEKRLARDLQNAGIEVILDRWHNAAIGSSVARFISLLEDPETFVVGVGTPLYRRKFANQVSKKGSVVAAEVDLFNPRYLGTEAQKATVLPVLLDGDEGDSFPPLMRGRVYADFRREDAYFSTLFDLILTLSGISFESPAVVELRETLTLGDRLLRPR